MSDRSDHPTDHPMDNIDVRPFRFPFDDIENGQLVWSRSCPEFSIFINALGVHVPYFERYLIAALNKAKPHITDARLRADVSAIIGQEAHHARNFIEFNKVMSRRYPRIGDLDAEARAHFAARAKTDGLKELVGFTAGYETFTFLAGMIVLDNYDRWMADSDAVMKALWVWHQVEEVEHGAVAFDAYQALFGAHEWYRKKMVVLAGAHIVCETMRAYFSMARVEGFLNTPVRAVTSTWFIVSTLARMGYHALPVLRRGYHPRKHPLVNDRQNPVAIGWRRFLKAGGDVLTIDRRKMSEILGLAPDRSH